MTDRRSGRRPVEMRLMALSACLAMLLLAACGGEDGGDAPTLAGPLVYERSGGSTGDKSRVTLQPNGRATFATARRAIQPQTDRQYVTELVDERSVKLDPAELERVSRQLREVDFAHLPARLLAPGEPIPDSCCGHTVLTFPVLRFAPWHGKGSTGGRGLRIAPTPRTSPSPTSARAPTACSSVVDSGGSVRRGGAVRPGRRSKPSPREVRRERCAAALAPATEGCAWVGERRFGRWWRDGLRCSPR